MIRYLDVDGQACPVLHCDACRQPITGMGNAYWVQLPNGATHPTIWHTHKAPCSSFDQVLEANTGGQVLSEELDVWLVQLAHNFKHFRQSPPKPGRRARNREVRAEFTERRTHGLQRRHQQKLQHLAQRQEKPE